MYTVLSTGSIQEHLAPSDIQGQIVPLSIVDVIVKLYQAPLPNVHHNFPGCELHSELHFLFLREDWEKKSAVDAMNRQTEDQGQVGGGVGGRNDCVHRHLDTSPPGEDDSPLWWDDAIWHGSTAKMRWSAPARETELLKNIHTLHRQTKMSSQWHFKPLHSYFTEIQSRTLPHYLAWPVWSKADRNEAAKNRFDRIVLLWVNYNHRTPNLGDLSR